MKFKPGDRVVLIRGGSGDRNEVVGARGTIENVNDHDPLVRCRYDNDSVITCYAWRFDPLPVSPFETALHAYILRELHQ